MSARKVETQDLTENRHIEVLYGSVPRKFIEDNNSLRCGSDPNARFIAKKHGVDLEFRFATFINNGKGDFFPYYLKYIGVGDDNRCTSAVLVGLDKESLKNAKEDIYLLFGCLTVNHGRFEISGNSPRI